jgi:hypothetical protein
MLTLTKQFPQISSDQLLINYSCSRWLPTWQRCEKPARTALEVLRQQTAGDVRGRGVKRQKGQLCRCCGSRPLAMKEAEV